jgi:amino acid adenylation domain-containing protein
VPGERLVMKLSYQPDLFDPGTVEMLGERLVRILRQMTADPQGLVAGIEVTDAAEQQLMVRERNDTARPMPTGTLAELFTAQVARTPEAPAVRCGATGLSYAELGAAAARLARYLIQLGIQPGQSAAVLVDRSARMIEAVLGVVLAGAAYVPVDPEYPADRIAFMLADAAPAAVVCTAALAGRLPADCGIPVVVLDDPAVAQAVAAGPGGDLAGLAAQVRPADLAYVIYTSGSTGTPKGVAVAHRSVANYLSHAAAAYPSSGERSWLHSPISFDLTVTALFTPLVAGGYVYVGELTDEQAVRGLDADAPLFLKVTPTHLHLLGTLPLAASSGDLVVGGEQLTGEMLRAWRHAHPAVTVVNEYGPTEATVGCTGYWIGPDDSLPADVVPVGRPALNSQLYVLDAFLRPVPPGMMGELYVAGRPTGTTSAGRLSSGPIQ